MKKVKFDFKDITIVPETISTIKSRGEINPYNKELYLPIMVSPMDTVVDEKNYKYNDKILDSLNKTINELKEQVNTQKLPNLPDVERKMFLNRRDVDVLYNDFTPPERRVQEYSYPYNYVKNNLNEKKYNFNYFDKKLLKQLKKNCIYPIKKSYE